MDVTAWLRGLGLEQYAPAFRDNDVDGEMLPELTADDLISIGVTSVGHRRKLLAAIAALRVEPTRDLAQPAVSATSTPVSPPISEAERRQLTVMFCDLVDSTGLSVRLDPEDLRAVIGGYHRCVAAVIERSGGFVAKYMGDGVLAYFGYPRADEHDAERAVRAGLALVEAVGRLDTAARAPLQARVGIATGLVVVGDLIGEGEARERSVVGETPNLAARLQALAEPGTVVIAPGTQRLTSGLFDYEDLGPIAIRGLAAPVTASRVLRESGAESRFEALRAARTLLVGRDKELALLQRRWQQAKAGKGSIVLLSGEPGIGKSRLAQTLIDHLSAEPHTRLRLFCSPHYQDHALYPTITQLERAAGFRREDTANERLDKLEAVLAQATDDPGEAVPLLAALLSLPIGGRYRPLDLTPQRQKERTLRALVAQVEGLAARQPVLMLFEDAQWSDPTSLELAGLIADRVPVLPVLLIVTFRPEFAPPWTGRQHVISLALNRLAPRQRAELIAGITGGKALPEEIAAEIIDRTDGVPLFVEELTKAVLEAGTQRAAALSATPRTAASVPATLYASLVARLDRLGPVAKDIVQRGAVIGREFGYELLALTTGLATAQLCDALDPLVDSGLVFVRGTPPDAVYTFKHALVRDAAYETLLRSRRQELHARIIEVLEGQFADLVERQPDLLAHHCTEAGLIAKVDGVDDDRHNLDGGDARLRDDRPCGADNHHARPSVAGVFGRRRIRQRGQFSRRARRRPSRVQRQLAICHRRPDHGDRLAIGFWARAGRKSVAGSAMIEAVSQLHKGLDLLAKLPEGPEPLRHELQLRIALGEALTASRGPAASETGQAYLRALEICQDLGDSEALPQILNGLCSYHMALSEFRAARDVAEQLLRHVETQGDPVTRMAANRNMGACLYWLGEFQPSATHMQRVLDTELLDLGGSIVPGSIYHLRVVALIYQSNSVCIQGHLQRGAVLSERSVTLGRATGHPQSLAFALSMAALLKLLSRAESDASSLLQELALLATDQKLPFWLGRANFLLGYTLTGCGRLAEGLTLAQKGFTDIVATGSTINHTCYLALMSQIHARAGDFATARGLLATAVAQADQSDERWFEAELHRLAGEWTMNYSAPAEKAAAEACFLRAVGTAQRQGARWWELRAATSLARLWRDQGKRAEARDLLAPVYGWFTEGSDTLDLKEVKALLDELTEPPIAAGG